MPSLPRKQTNLETANEMYKAAFRVKKHKFALENPELTEEELHRKTVEYFQCLTFETFIGSPEEIFLKKIGF